MKSIVLFAAGVTAMSGGCASVADRHASDMDNVDVQKVAAINNVAKARGVRVLWVRYPQLKAHQAAVVPSPAEPAGS
jgi:hypothetical protein